MDIKYTIINNDCYFNSNGIITINNIKFDDQNEANQFLSYDIIWSGDLTDTVLSKDKRILYNLKNGIYYFQIKSLSSDYTSSIYECQINTPEPLSITSVVASKYSCHSDGQISVSVTGGQAPYIYSNGIHNIVSDLNIITFTDLSEGTYHISVQDHNGCKVIYDETVVIQNNNILLEIDKILTPLIIDSYVPTYFTIKGANGPFDLVFYNTYSNEQICVSHLDKQYVIDDSILNTYKYFIPDKLSPGQYDVTISSVNGCSFVQSFYLPNILPLVVNCNITSNTVDNNIVSSTTLPIFDTLLIPYNLMISNPKVLEAIKGYSLKQTIPIKINDILHKFTITRNILNRYILESGQIEVLRLGDNPQDWYFYLQIAPGINLEKNPEHNSASIVINIQEEDFPITLGVSKDGNLDTEHISLVRGSLIMSGVLDNQFNKKEYYISLKNEINSLDEYDFLIQDSKITTHKNTYNAGSVTIVNFLSNFEQLNQIVYLHDTNTVELSPENQSYLINIKNLLSSMNNIHNTIYIYFNNTNYNGSLNLFISGQPYFITTEGRIENQYSIDYYYCNQSSTKLNDLYKNNQKIINDVSLRHLPEGIIVVKIKDLFNNKPKIIKNGQHTILYDDHFVSLTDFIKKYNESLLSFIEYGDIICYIPNSNAIVDVVDIPTFIPPNFVPNRQDIVLFNRYSPTKQIKQTEQNTNTSLNIKIYPKKTKCVLKGPNNYQLSINEDIKLINMIPGVYNICGDDQDLFDKNLYQNLNRITIDKNNNLDIEIKFTSYDNKIFIKETE